MPSLTVENYAKAIYQLALRGGRWRCRDGPNCGCARRVARHRDEHAQNARRKQPGDIHALRGRAADAVGPGAGPASVAAASADRAVSQPNAQSQLGRSPRRSRAHGARRERLRWSTGSTPTWAIRRPIRTATRFRKADGTVAAAADRPLADCAVGDRFRIARVIDQSTGVSSLFVAGGLGDRREGSLVAKRRGTTKCVTIRLAAHEKTVIAAKRRQIDGALDPIPLLIAAYVRAYRASFDGGRRPRVQLRTVGRSARPSGEGPLQRGPREPGQGGNTAAISPRLFVWGPLTGGRSDR